MPKRSRKPKSDEVLSAFETMQRIIERTEAAPESQNEALPAKNPAAVALGRLGGLKGGKARADALSDKRKREIAQKAAKARWSHHK